MVLETHMKLCVAESDFPGKLFLSKKWENVPKTVSFKFNGKFHHQLFLNLVYKEIL